MTILKENLIIALETAINNRRDFEKNVLKYNGDSALVAGWEQVVTALRNGENVTIKNECTQSKGDSTEGSNGLSQNS